MFENMSSAIVSLLDLSNKLRLTGGERELLTHLEYVFLNE